MAILLIFILLSNCLGGGKEKIISKSGFGEELTEAVRGQEMVNVLGVLENLIKDNQIYSTFGTAEEDKISTHMYIFKNWEGSVKYLSKTIDILPMSENYEEYIKYEDSQGANLIHYMVRYSDPYTLRICLEKTKRHGVDLDEILNSKANMSFLGKKVEDSSTQPAITPLVLSSAIHNDVKMAEVLISSKKEIDMNESLLYAIALGKKKAFDFLVKEGALVPYSNKERKVYENKDWETHELLYWTKHHDKREMAEVVLGHCPILNEKNEKNIYRAKKIGKALLEVGALTAASTFGISLELGPLKSLSNNEPTQEKIEIIDFITSIKEGGKWLKHLPEEIKVDHLKMWKSISKKFKLAIQSFGQDLEEKKLKISEIRKDLSDEKKEIYDSYVNEINIALKDIESLNRAFDKIEKIPKVDKIFNAIPSHEKSIFRESITKFGEDFFNMEETVGYLKNETTVLRRTESNMRNRGSTRGKSLKGKKSALMGLNAFGKEMKKKENSMEGENAPMQVEEKSGLLTSTLESGLKIYHGKKDFWDSIQKIENEEMELISEEILREAIEEGALSREESYWVKRSKQEIYRLFYSNGKIRPSLSIYDKYTIVLKSGKKKS